MVGESSNGMPYDQGLKPFKNKYKLYKLIYVIAAGIRNEPRLTVGTQSTITIGGTPNPGESSTGMAFKLFSY